MNKFARWIKTRRWEKQYVAHVSPVGKEPLPRIKAHFKNLDEYWLRWLGFCRLPNMSPQSAIDNSLFIVVEAASKITKIDVIRLEASKANDFKQTWLEYDESLQNLKKCSVEKIKTEAEQTYLKFKTCIEIFLKEVVQSGQI
ncbi:MAG TPA: hypothetical protein VIK59_11840 [Verrucomicrobiae bacterium]